jgi:hypothetical protein
MALIKCPACEAEVSSNAKACPKCGEPIRQGTWVFGWICLAAIGLGLAISFMGRPGWGVPLIVVALAVFIASSLFWAFSSEATNLKAGKD